jgi:hypothetical protein
MARSWEDLGTLTSSTEWTQTRTTPAVGVWTDDFSNIVTLLLKR